MPTTGQPEAGEAFPLDDINRSIVDNAPVGLALYKATGECMAANAAAGSILGASAAQLMAENFYQIDLWKRSGLYEAARTALAENRATTSEDEFVSSRGVPLWVRSVFSSFQSGGELRLLMVNDDLTERRRGENALRQSEERLHILVDSAPYGVYIQSRGRFEYVNPAMATLLAYQAPEELVGKEVVGVIAPEHKSTAGGRLRANYETGGPAATAEVDYVRPDGSRVAVEATAIAQPVSADEVYLVFVRDRSERQKVEAERAKLQEQLMQAQRMETAGQLAGGIAHDFNNILMVMKGYCELLRMSAGTNEGLASSVAQIESYADRAVELTRQLLAFGRKQTLNPVVIDLNNLVTDMEHMLRRLVGESIQVVVVLAPHPAVVTADRSQIEQVLVNLAVNARDAMPRGGKLTVRISWVDVDAALAEGDPNFTPGPYIMLALTDTGVGMDAEDKRRVFEPFFSPRGETKGGLGLSTVYGVVHQSGGTIRVESELGRGTTFSVFLPRVEVTISGRTDRAGRKAPTGKELVLIVEDEATLRGLVVMMLEKLGYAVREAPNGMDALRMVEEGGLYPDLLLADVVMPEMSGSELVERLRGRMPGLRVIYMSGYADETILDHGVAGPGFEFLRKPFSMSDLEAKLTSVLGTPKP